MACWLGIAHFTLHYFCCNPNNVKLWIFSFFGCYFFKKHFRSIALCCLSISYIVLSVGHVDGDGGNLVVPFSDEQREQWKWNVCGYHIEHWREDNCHQTNMEMLQQMGLNPPLFYFKPQHVSQIYQIRINTTLWDSYQVVKLLGEFLNPEDHSKWSAETYTKHMLGELRVLKYY